MSAGVPFQRLRAVEELDARAEVYEFADELYADQVAIWQSNARRGAPNKMRERPSFAFYLADSRRVRLKRERDHRYFNQLTARNPLY